VYYLTIFTVAMGVFVALPKLPFMYRGDTNNNIFGELLNNNISISNMSVPVVTCTCKYSILDSDAQAIFSKVSTDPSQIAIVLHPATTNPVASAFITIQIYIKPEDTANINFAQDRPLVSVVDLQIVEANGIVTTLGVWTMEIRPEVSRGF
jgi:hypothetical protein